MKRLFGGSKPQAPPVSLEETATKMGNRVDMLDEKIKKLDTQLVGYKNQLKQLKPGAARNRVQQDALRILKQKKIYEQQRDNISNQAFNVEQTHFATQNMRDTVETVKAMKSASVALKSEMKTMDINEIENMQDDLSDLMLDSNEIQEALGRSYLTPDIDEGELEDELDQLGDELLNEATPSYLSALPATPTEPATAKQAVPMSNQ